MRKRIVNHLANTIFWHLLYFLPVILFVVYLIAEPNAGTSLVNFSAFLDSVGLGVVANNGLTQVFADIFGQNGVMPIFTDNSVFVFFTYYIVVYLLHTLVDLLLLLPKIVHNFTKKIGGADE